MLVYVDFETFYSRKEKFDLRELSIVEYVRDSRFVVQGVGIAVDDGPVDWLTAYQSLAAFDWVNATVVAHNAKFDAFILAEKFGIKPKQWIDTKALAKAVLGKTVPGFSLKELAEHFGLESKGILKTDGKRDLTPAERAELGEYCKHDVDLCREIYKRLITDFPENQLPMMDWTVRTFVNPTLRLNTNVLETCAADEKLRRETAIAKTGLEKKVFSSNPQFAALLESKGYEVPTKKSPRTGKEIPALALGDPEFLGLAENESNEELYSLCQARIAAKSTLLQTRSEKLAAISKTGPWGFDIEFSGATQTHRFSGGKGAGGNPQNFTRGSALRDAVEAPEGHQLIVGDFSNIELRIVAYLSKDRGLIQALELDRDLYCEFASAFFGRTITKADKLERQFGKTAILGLGYGMGAKKFRRTVLLQTGLKISQEEAEKAVDLYRKRYWGVPKLWDWLDSRIPVLAAGKGVIFTNAPFEFDEGNIYLPSQLKLQYPELRKFEKDWVYNIWDKSKTAAVTRKLYGGKVLENISQALAGELCKEVAQQFLPWLTGLVHDEIHLSVPRAMASIMAARLKRAMETAPSWMPEMRLKAEVHTGNNWGVCK